MKSKVFFTDLRVTPQQNIFKKLDKLLVKAEFNNIIEKGDMTAIKLHFGERGNTSYVKPIYLRRIVDKVKSLGGMPFLTDTNTLYVGNRKESVTHIETAIGNGFDYSVVNAPIIIADGLRGKSYEMVRIDKKWYKEVDIATEIHNADSLIAVTHFKCHELSGIGGVIKNIGMGCATLKGKLNQHSNVKPFVVADECTGCMRCIPWCPAEGAIVKIENNKITLTELEAQINTKRQEINNTNPRSSQYNAKVDEYNNLVAQYNQLANSTKDLIVNYNSQINAFNECVVGN